MDHRAAESTVSMPAMNAPETRPQRPRDLRLTRWFVVVGAAAIGLFSLAVGAALGEFLASRMLARDAEVSRDFVQSIVATQGADAAFEAGRVTGQPAFVEFFAHVAAIPGVLRANVWSLDRTVLWSSSPELIGRRFESNDELDEALAGRVVVHRAQAPEDDKAEHMLLAGRGGDFVENYLPVRDTGSARVIGAVELYRNQAALFEAIRSGQRLVWLSAGLGGLFLFACLVWFVRSAERALREQQARLVEAEALAIVGELSAAVAHNIRNPLGSIRSTAELQRELGAERAAMDDVIRGVDRIDTLVGTLLAYAADPAGHGRSADLDEVLGAAQRRHAADFAAQGKPFEVDLRPPLGRVQADAVLLAQVIDSLLANASEATAPGEAVRLQARRAGSRAVVEVLDDGHGIGADADRQRLFQPFHTTKPRGLGMGLALARRVVLRLGGRIELEPRTPKGTVARIELPVA